MPHVCSAPMTEPATNFNLLVITLDTILLSTFSKEMGRLLLRLSAFPGSLHSKVMMLNRWDSAKWVVSLFITWTNW